MRIVETGLVVALAVAGAVLAAAPAQAQSNECSKLQGMLQERQALVARLNGGGTKKKITMTPQAACGLLGQLVSNGNRTIAFINANKDWCQIPDNFAEGMKADNARAVGIRGQACRAASQQAVAQRRAQQQAQQQQQNRGGFGGGDSVVGGGWRIPQGAL